eukprot:5318197-Amphidinium_carterae.1
MGCRPEQYVTGVGTLCRLVHTTAATSEHATSGGVECTNVYISHATSHDGHICSVGYPSDRASTWHCSSLAIDLFRQRHVCDRDNLLRDGWVVLAKDTLARAHAVSRRGFYCPATTTLAKLQLGELRITD